MPRQLNRVSRFQTDTLTLGLGVSTLPLSLPELNGVHTQIVSVTSAADGTVEDAAPWGESFVALDNGGTAWSRMTGPVGVETVRKLVIGVRFRFDSALSNCRVFSDVAATALSLQQPLSTRLRLFGASGNIVLEPDTPPLDAVMRTHLITVDLAVANTCQWWADGSQLLNNALGTNGSQVTGTYDTSDFGLNSGTNGVGLCQEWDGGGFNNFDGAVEFLWIDWGGAAYTLPDITDSTIRAKWGPTQIGADGSGPTGASPKLFWAAADLAEANSAGGIPNRGSLADLPMVKQAGTYS